MKLYQLLGKKRLRAITLHGAIEQSPILLLQYWKNI